MHWLRCLCHALVNLGFLCHVLYIPQHWIQLLHLDFPLTPSIIWVVLMRHLHFVYTKVLTLSHHSFLYQLKPFWWFLLMLRSLQNKTWLFVCWIRFDCLAPLALVTWLEVLVPQAWKQFLCGSGDTASKGLCFTSVEFSHAETVFYVYAIL